MSQLARGFLSAAALLATPSLAFCDPPAEAKADPSRAAERARTDAEHLARLHADARAFLELPADRRAQLFQLENELASQSTTAQGHLLEVARRYADWLETLPELDRRRITEAPDRDTRLQRVRELREREWVNRLPRAHREKLEKVWGTDRARLLKQFRQEERQRRREWQIAIRHWDDLIKKNQMPASLSDFSQDVQAYVNEYLRPRLTPEEKARLEKVEGQWPAFPTTLVALADRHPNALPGARGPITFKELPHAVQEILNQRIKKVARPGLKKAEGNWPEYGMAVVAFAKSQGLKLPYELWPSRRDDLSAPVVQFLDKKLLPALDENEKQKLKDAEGKWPLYPRTIQELALAHKLHVPWQTLPGPRPMWDSYRQRAARANMAQPNPTVQK
jgi:hypothetical protein